MSPLLQWRGPIYIAAGFAGIFAFCLILLQPLFISGDLPTTTPRQARKYHRMIGIGIVFFIVVHVAGLYWVSPMDVMDVLLFRSPTPFGLWGAIGFYALFALSLVLLFKGRLSLKTWQQAHLTLAALIAITSILHAIQIEGTMETVSKWLVSLFILGAIARLLWFVRRELMRR